LEDFEMAPTLPGARKKRATQVKLLDNTIRKLAEACAEADPPSNTAIIRLIAAVDQQYEKVQLAHDDIVSLLEDADDEAEDAVLVGIDTGVSAAKEIAHRVIDARHTGSGGDSERAPRSPSGSTGGRSHMSMDQRLAILKGSRDNLTVRIEHRVHQHRVGGRPEEGDRPRRQDDGRAGRGHRRADRG
jgi:hypothetical protein